MSTTDHQSEVERWRECWRLQEAVDRDLEIAMLERETLEGTLARLFPRLAAAIGATAAWIRTSDEELVERDFRLGDSTEGTAAEEIDELLTALSTGSTPPAETGAGDVIAQALDVAGTAFGAVAAVVPERLDAAAREHRQRLLHIWCEGLDNHLAAISLARRKQQIGSAFAEALKNPVLHDGIDAGLALLNERVGVEDLILVYRHHDVGDAGPIAYKVMRDGVLVYDSRTELDDAAEAFAEEHQLDLLIRGDSESVAERFGLARFHEEVLISGLRAGQLVGRLLVARRGGQPFSTFDRDLLQRFAEFLRLRIVDFNREWRHLSLNFPRTAVRRLVAESGYAARYLTPRERDVAILYCDIVGFTRVSEQVLQQPELIGRLVDSWSSHVVDILWESGGVFDKMVGDCIIGLWGPPFFEMSAEQSCRRAARAALAIRDYTRDYATTGDLPELAAAGVTLGVATGLNFCPLYVGRFGPSEDYTGFSSGMNNTARLQGVAEQDEILCMDSFTVTIGDAAQFGAPGQAQVKNVSEPLRYRPLEALSHR